MIDPRISELIGCMTNHAVAELKALLTSVTDDCIFQWLMRLSERNLNPLHEFLEFHLYHLTVLLNSVRHMPLLNSPLHNKGICRTEGHFSGWTGHERASTQKWSANQAENAQCRKYVRVGLLGDFLACPLSAPCPCHCLAREQMKCASWWNAVSSIDRHCLDLCLVPCSPLALHLTVLMSF